MHGPGALIAGTQYRMYCFKITRDDCRPGFFFITAHGAQHGSFEADGRLSITKEIIEAVKKTAASTSPLPSNKNTP